jgi:hypothetical protein
MLGKTKGVRFAGETNNDKGNGSNSNKAKFAGR